MSTTGAPTGRDATAEAGFTDRLDDADTLLWSIERDPRLRTTILAISVLDHSPGLAAVRELLEHACDVVPRLRQRVVEPPIVDVPLLGATRFGAPHWRTVDEFDLDAHLRHVVAPAPGDLAALLDIAAPIVMAAFDKDRPLWEFTLVEGLADGRAALIQKIHHAVTDGVGGVQLASLLLDGATSPTAAPERRHRSRPSPLGTALQATVSAISDPVGSARAALRTVRSVSRLLAPVTRPLSPVMTGRSTSRRLTAFDLPLDDVLAAAHAAGSTLNDAFLAAVTDGMRRYHEAHDAPVPALRITMPISIRQEGDGLGANRFVPVRLTVPLDAVGPQERMHRLGQLTRKWRAEPALPHTNTIAGSLNRLPGAVTTAIFGGMLEAIDLVATNVPGFTQPMHLCGAEVIREYAFGPPSGAALSVTLLSHVDRCCIGIAVDTAAVPDPDVLTECIRAGFDDVIGTRSTWNA